MMKIIKQNYFNILAIILTIMSLRCSIWFTVNIAVCSDEFNTSPDAILGNYFLFDFLQLVLYICLIVFLAISIINKNKIILWSSLILSTCILIISTLLSVQTITTVPELSMYTTLGTVTSVSILAQVLLISIIISINYFTVVDSVRLEKFWKIYYQ